MTECRQVILVSASGRCRTFYNMYFVIFFVLFSSKETIIRCMRLDFILHVKLMLYINIIITEPVLGSRTTIQVPDASNTHENIVNGQCQRYTPCRKSHEERTPETSANSSARILLPVDVANQYGGFDAMVNGSLKNTTRLWFVFVTFVFRSAFKLDLTRPDPTHLLLSVMQKNIFIYTITTSVYSTVMNRPDSTDPKLSKSIPIY